MTTNMFLGTLLHLSWEKHFVKAHNHLPKGTQAFSQEHGSQGNTTIFQKQLSFPKGNSFKDLDPTQMNDKRQDTC
jgi:hypothetical protein